MSKPHNNNKPTTTAKNMAAAWENKFIKKNPKPKLKVTVRRHTMTNFWENRFKKNAPELIDGPKINLKSVQQTPDDITTIKHTVQKHSMNDLWENKFKNKSKPIVKPHQDITNNTVNQQFKNQLNNILSKKDISNQDDTEQDEKTQQMLTCVPDEVVPPQIPQTPQKNARAFFTDDIVSPHGTKPYELNGFSDYVGAGPYPNNRVAFPNASNGTFDGIAIDANTRVILWENPNFEGNVLLDQIGPAIVNNVAHKNISLYQSAMTDAYADPDLQQNYPPHTRIWSNSNMQTWTSGSVKIVAANTRN